MSFMYHVICMCGRKSESEMKIQISLEEMKGKLTGVGRNTKEQTKRSKRKEENTNIKI